MKICAVICEFNPFHNGHKYLLEKARTISGCDALLCIMSGSFTQRGEMCILDKYTRASHAVLGGADCVIQLPAHFAVAPAEIFAKGAVKILSAIPSVTTLAFGCESGSAEEFLKSADMLINESDKFKTALSKNLASGESYIKSYSAAFELCGGNKSTISNPNNILGLEYTKAIKRLNCNIEILPIKRIGSGYNDTELKDNYSSASAIRKNLRSPLIKSNLPKFVADDLKENCNLNDFNFMLRHSLFKADAENLKAVYGCGEGLENKLKSLVNLPLEKIIENATSKRYPSSRIKRILLCNALGLNSDDTQKFLQSELYIKPLAIKKERADEILSALAKSNYPIITGIDCSGLNTSAKQCFLHDRSEFELYNFLGHTDIKDYMLTI